MATEQLTEYQEQAREDAAKLREPFPESVIGKLPRRTKNGKTIHLDYVGHAAVTDRLLQVDPGWRWEPLAIGDDGLPVFDKAGGLWIRLQVGRFEMLGYGDAQGKTGPNAVKEAIGDAIRNAAMRLGVALDLWAKEPLSDDGEEETAPKRQAAPKQEAKKSDFTAINELLNEGLPPVEAGPLALTSFIAQVEGLMVDAGLWGAGTVVASLEKRGTSLQELASEPDELREFAEAVADKALSKVLSS